MKIYINLFSFFILLGFSSFNTKNCDSKLELKETKETSFIINIETSNSFSAEIFYIKDGEYFSKEIKSGNGNSEIEFTGIEKNVIYKIVVKYSDSNPLCQTRQLSGLKL